MLCKRLIPCLDVDKGRVVKGVNFVDIRDAGNPAELARKYYENGADEICFLDITASSEERKAIYQTIKETAKEIFIPLTVGGGVSSLEDAAKLLEVGADKIAINSSAIKNPQLISQLAENFGCQCVVIAIDVKRNQEGLWEVFIKGGKEATGINAIDWIKKSYDLGAGEILLTSMDRDGTKTGYDLEITQIASNLVPIPIIASGGAGSLEDIINALKAGADAALLASILHFGKYSIQEIKFAMKSNQIETR